MQHRKIAGGPGIILTDEVFVKFIKCHQKSGILLSEVEQIAVDEIPFNTHLHC